MKTLRIIGDVHGKLKQYVNIAQQADYSLCVGDVGFEYDYLNNLYHNIHKCVGGNHDNYTTAVCQEDCKGEECLACEGRGYVFPKQSNHFLKDFGILNIGNLKIFYVRGAWSIDRDYRVDGLTWWKDEELTHAQMLKAIDLYEKEKPAFVVSHTAPLSIVPYIPFDRTFGDVIHTPMTERMLDNMYNLHQPDSWVFGHWHKSWKQKVPHKDTNKLTEFICLAELEHMDLPFVDNG